MVQTSTGIDFARLVVRAACGHEPETALLPPVPPRSGAARRTAANWIIPLGGHGCFAGLSGLNEVLAHPDTLEVLQFLTVGDEVPAWPRFGGYPGFVLSEHDSHAAGQRFHRWLARILHACWEDPAGPVPASVRPARPLSVIRGVTR